MRKQSLILRLLLLFLALLPVQKSHALTNNLALTPPMGWNDWNSYGCGISESAVTNTINIVATNGMAAAGYQFIDIDDGWASSRDSNGVIQAYSISSKFPHGIKWLADYAHASGLKLGIYTDHGTNTCSDCIGGATPPNQPGSFGYEYVDAFTYGSWGVDYLKDDNCKVPDGAVAEVDYSRMSDGLMKSGRPIVFCLCGGASFNGKSYQSWSPVLGNYWRTTDDIGDTYASMISHIDLNSTTAFAAGPGRWNDPDMLEVGRGGMTVTEDQTHFTMWCIMAAPLIMGNNLTTMSAQALTTLTNPEAIAVDQDPAGEEGIKVVNNVSSTSTNEVWSRTLGYDFSTKAVVLFNRLGAAANITVNWTNLGLQAGPATVRDLWAHSDLGTFTNGFTTNVASHTAILLKVVGTPPVLPGLGTNYLTGLGAVYTYTGWGTIVKDKSIGGNTITLGSVTYPKGIGVNSRSGADYDLGGICSRFQATIGVDDEVGSSGSVIFQVFADGMEIYNSGVMTGSSPSQNIDLDVTGVRRLILGVGDADNGTSNDHADWANALVVVTNTTPRLPYAPIGFRASPGNSITLTWNSTLAAITYNVKQATNSGGPYTTITNVPITTFTDSNVVSGTNYYYVVSALSSIGEGSNSVEVSAAPCSVPLAPTNVVATASNSPVVVCWNASAGATSYNVERFTGTTPPIIIASGVTATNFTDTPGAAAATNYYLVFAVNACNQSDWSAFAAAVAPPAPPPPSITTPPASQTNIVSQTAMFTVTAVGTQPLYYQWRAGATGGGVYTNLIAGGQFSAVTNATLYITNLVSGNAADYVVVITNANGSVTSAVATLTVFNAAPSITTQPAGQTNIVGQTATFTVTAVGLPPLYYQWRAGATGGGVYTNLIAGGQFSAVTNATMTITNVVTGNAADYVVVVTNSYGSVTSTVMRLTVLTNSSYQSTILADHPVSYWPLNETSGTIIHDVVGTNNGTCMNTSGLTLGGPGILYGQGVTSETAIYFTNTSSGYIKVPYSATLNTPQFTVEVWLNMPTFPATGAGADMNALSFDDSNPKGWTFEISNPNAANPNMYGWLGHNNSWTRVNSGTCIQGQWSYYALTYDGTTFTVYTNGVSAGSQSSSYTQVSSSHSLYMGAYDSGGSVTRFYSGGMENVAFYSNALSASQILNHYQVGSTVVPPAPPSVSVQRSGANVIVSWANGFLQRANSVTGPWTDVTNAVSPYAVEMTNSALFFRATLQSPP
jgi:alpha-galactosidase